MGHPCAGDTIPLLASPLKGEDFYLGRKNS